MILRYLCIAGLLASLCGCEKGRELLRGAAKLEAIQPGGEIDETLEAKVVRDHGGVRFRRDLPFPRECTVRVVEVTRFEDFRGVETSAFGKEVKVMSGRTEMSYLFNKTPGMFGIEIEKSRLIPKVEVDGRSKDGESTAVSDLEGISVLFVLTKDGWRSRNDGGPVDFKQVVWADSLSDSVPAQMVEAGVHPRAQWFSSSRTWHEGHSTKLVGSALKILKASDVSGEMTLVFEGEEAVGGHPCGVFSMSGSLVERDAVAPDGTRRDVEYSISSGKIWASLLYPVVLREEHEAVVTMKVRKGRSKDAPSRRMQGPVTFTRSLAWQPN